MTMAMARRLIIWTSLSNRPPAFAESQITIRVNENTESGEHIGISGLTARDPDGDDLTYELGGPEEATFDVNPSSGQLVTAGQLDFETRRTYRVTITVEDPHGGVDTIMTLPMFERP